MEESVLEAVKKAREVAKKRNFSQTFDLIVNLKFIDLKKPENRINEILFLPKGRGKNAKIVVFSDSIKDPEIKVYKSSDIERLGTNKRALKKLVKETDFFLAEPKLMPIVGKNLGRVLAPRGKMPTVIAGDVKQMIKRYENSVRLKVKDSPVVQCMVGTEGMKDEDVSENIRAVLEFLEKRLPKGRNSIGEVMIKLRQEIEKSPVIALVDMHKMPSKQLQEIRKALREKAKIKMIKKSILKFALEKVENEKIKELEKYVPTQPALVFTNIEAFKFYNLVEDLRFKTFAKSGDIATEDIWISAGPTQLMAGPVISELQQAGVPASIESGRIKIRKDVCIVKKGEEISELKAGVLRKLKIEPMEVVLNVVAVYDNGNIYTKEALELTKTFPEMLVKAFNNALNLSVFIEFPTKQNIKYLLIKAVRAANAIKSLIKSDVKEKEIESKEVSAEVGTKEGKDVNDSSKEEGSDNKVEGGGAS